MSQNINHLLWLIGHTLNTILGTSSQDSFMYKFWSAPGGALLVIGAMYGYWKHNKCHRCLLLGKHVPNYHWPYCVFHRPVKAEDSKVAG